MDPASGGGETGKELENCRVGVVQPLGKLFPSGMRNLGSFMEAQGREPMRGRRWENQQGWEFAVGMAAAGIFPNSGRISFRLDFLGWLGAAQIHPSEGSGLGWAFPGIQQRR